LVCGKLSERIAQAETRDLEMIGQAFTAGMLHDIGKLLLAANLPSEFKQALARARQETIQLWEAESKVLGVTHAELGACLLGIWGLPVPIVEAVALHHLPSRFLSKSFCPLTAVHAANAIEHQTHPENQGLPLPSVDVSYLADLGLSERLEHWQDLGQEKAS
jgi:HD-like signal output (HDOD) protein